MRNQVVRLKDEPYRRISVCVPVFVVKFRSGHSADDEIAAGVTIKSADYVEHGGFATAARSENCNKFALSKIERNFAQRVHRRGCGRIIFYDVFKLKHNAPLLCRLF